MIFLYLTYVLAILLGIFCPDYIIDKGSVGAEPLTLGTICTLYLIVGGFWWLRKYKHHPIIGPVYQIVRLFFIVLFATLMANYIKKEVKEWWKSES